MMQIVQRTIKGCIGIHDEQRSGQPSVPDKTIAKVEQTMMKNRRLTVQELSEMIPDVSKTYIDNILTDNL